MMNNNIAVDEPGIEELNFMIDSVTEALLDRVYKGGDLDHSYLVNLLETTKMLTVQQKELIENTVFDRVAL